MTDQPKRKMTPHEVTAKARAARVQKGPKRRDAGGFTDGERAYVLYYMGAANRIGTEAALMAGYGKGSRGAAKRYAYELMQRPHIVAEIERLTAERNERLQYSSDDVLRDMLILKTETELLPNRNAPIMRTRLDILAKIGDHVGVNAFRKQVGLSSPTGGPIEHVDAAWLADATDEELDALEHARSIIDRRAGATNAIPDGSGDTGGEGTAPEEA